MREELQEALTEVPFQEALKERAIQEALITPEVEGRTLMARWKMNSEWKIVCLDFPKLKILPVFGFQQQGTCR